MENNEIKSCVGCVYFYTTWDKAAPKGCRYFGFKSFKMPCMVVKQSTGTSCTFYTKRI